MYVKCLFTFMTFMLYTCWNKPIQPIHIRPFHSDGNCGQNIKQHCEWNASRKRYKGMKILPCNLPYTFDKMSTYDLIHKKNEQCCKRYSSQLSSTLRFLRSHNVNEMQHSLSTTIRRWFIFKNTIILFISLRIFTRMVWEWTQLYLLSDLSIVLTFYGLKNCVYVSEPIYWVEQFIYLSLSFSLKCPSNLDFFVDGSKDGSMVY